MKIKGVEVFLGESFSFAVAVCQLYNRNFGDEIPKLDDTINACISELLQYPEWSHIDAVAVANARKWVAEALRVIRPSKTNTVVREVTQLPLIADQDIKPKKQTPFRTAGEF